MELNCFVSAPAGISVDLLRRVMEGVGVSVRPIDFSANSTLYDSIFGAIKSCNFVVGVVGKEGPVSNVSFELGMSKALEKPILLFNESGSVEYNVLGDIVFRSDVENESRLRSQVEMFLKFLKSDVYRAPKKPESWSLDSLGTSEVFGFFESEGVKHIAEILKGAGATVTASEERGPIPSTGARPDLLAWWDDPRGQFLNPTVVELKLRTTGKPSAGIVRQVRLLMESSGAGAGLIIVSGTQSLQLVGGLPNVFCMGLEDLEKHAQSPTLVLDLRKLRNQASHGVR